MAGVAAWAGADFVVSSALGRCIPLSVACPVDVLAFVDGGTGRAFLAAATGVTGATTALASALDINPTACR